MPRRGVQTDVATIPRWVAVTANREPRVERADLG